MESNPNTSAAAVAGAIAALGLGLAGIWVAVPALVASAVTTLIVAAVLYVGREGFNGLADRLWRGSDEA
jgi:divalent metal cation (Fe/Co/Zn/Cd) transporter